ncbi:ring-cleaving dioxygenase [Phytoactinopolyspora halotolerans]|uniref:Ring-cleaving dioxygenase n=1 Tax=Phytoactinopolyspora halotolerans TaxID=1981512 RepID=A0A6L9SCE1_9ACTN|nr:ring-cleaving dioxygenase [Phytoactinopolyspora halotolerans]NEE02679.1 ring-cleaving dioxygenase [Phytoactinopolyspora halotolerans]
MSTVAPHGLHHVTAIADDPQRNVDFYTQVLGLRLVKQTVNFDAPDTYHLYYGDEVGRPSSVLTFFPWRGVPAGRQGTGLTTATAFSVPEGSTGWWHERLKAYGVPVDAPRSRDGEDVVTFRDPDGLVVDLVAAPGDRRSGWDGVASIPSDHAVRGLHSVTMSERLLDPTAEMLTAKLGMELGGEASSRARFSMAQGNSGALVDVAASEADRGLQAGGTVHHVAFRAPDLATMTRWRDELVEAGIHVTEIMDRQYFMSIYFREPGGVLFEIATDTPGFDIDEPLLELGRSLKLPPWLEPSREDIQANLPPLHLVP